MSPPFVVPLVALGMLLVWGVGFAILLRKFYVKVPPGAALYVSRAPSPTMSLTGAFVFPYIHRAQLIDITVKRIDVVRTVTARDGKRVDVEASFFFSVHATIDDVRRVAERLGALGAAAGTVRERFEPKCSEALDIVAAVFSADDIVSALERAQFRDRLFDIIGKDLDGFHLDDVSVTSARLSSGAST